MMPFKHTRYVFLVLVVTSEAIFVPAQLAVSESTCPLRRWRKRGLTPLCSLGSWALVGSARPSRSGDVSAQKPSRTISLSTSLLSRQFYESLLHFDSDYQREKSMVGLNKQIACSLLHVLIAMHTTSTSAYLHEASYLDYLSARLSFKYLKIYLHMLKY